MENKQPEIDILSVFEAKMKEIQDLCSEVNNLISKQNNEAQD
jgi:hypothetical protein